MSIVLLLELPSANVGKRRTRWATLLSKSQYSGCGMQKVNGFQCVFLVVKKILVH